ncbi:hypothetical protein [Parvicella tangerina]|nr:hypothetical protein [Parvicella tangerina]
MYGEVYEYNKEVAKTTCLLTMTTDVEERITFEFGIRTEGTSTIPTYKLVQMADPIVMFHSDGNVIALYRCVDLAGTKCLVYFVENSCTIEILPDSGEFSEARDWFTFMDGSKF